MKVKIHPHARARMIERGASEREISETVSGGEPFPAKFGRMGFRRNFLFGSTWRGKIYATKQVEVIAVREEDTWLVLTLLVKFF